MSSRGLAVVQHTLNFPLGVDDTRSEEKSQAMADDGEALAQLTSREQEVNSLLQARKHGEALQKALEAPPFECKDEAVKESSYQVVSKVVDVIKDDELKTTVLSLTPEVCDVLMKYVYKGLSLPDNNGKLLTLHGILVGKAGQGCVLRAMTDIKRKAN